ncbi:hypothetical protein D0868_09193 [Hortaea werneckii]|uniref:Xylanolytic transcriptional activator regulatory domain-containing protein n=1 Tax=Hortaea werneckii TaxID=91943 RepID=A0A3M7B9S2_HORWE|nr:hypothetical protein D0868_09193 [Hortaea werneckii]RMY36496.1 hypothetical protein D0866_03891 [Hortaea werneckii]
MCVMDSFSSSLLPGTYLSPYTRGKAPDASTTLTPPESQHACDSRQADADINVAADAIPTAPKDSGQLTGGMSSRAVSPEVDVTPAGHYLGPTSPFSFLRRASRRFGHLGTPLADKQDSELDVSIFSYGDRRLPDLSTTGIRLPEQAKASALMNRYFEFAAPTYRFLHEPTIRDWYDRVSTKERNPSQPHMLAPIQRAILFLVMATATLYSANAGDEVLLGTHENDEEPWLVAERYYQAAHGIIAHETGSIRLESIQARLASLSFLLNTSRLNQAWFTFGTCFQLILTLGMHRKSPEDGPSHDFITQECRKRCFWTAYTLDGYFSVMLGRPPFFHDSDIDQRLPTLVNDSDILASGIVPRAYNKDCMIAAALHHAKLARIVKQASREQYLLQRPKDQQQIETAQRLNTEIAEWRQGLPVFLSGAIHPSTLVPVFRRQLTVLRIACAHAVMLINRPLILLRKTDPSSIEPQVTACLDAARQVLDLVLEFVAENHLFSAFWNTQTKAYVPMKYVTFNALSIAYVWIIQRRIGRLNDILPTFDLQELFDTAETVQMHLAAVTRSNAPNLRYSIILGELQQEARRVLNTANTQFPETPMDQSGQQDSAAVTDMSMTTLPGETPSDWSGRFDFPLDPNLWLQLDSFPFSKSSGISKVCIFRLTPLADTNFLG